MNELQAIKHELQAKYRLSVSERGTGGAAFLYACSETRSVEIFPAEMSGFIVECWNTANEESDNPPTSEETVPSAAAAVAKVFKWLIA